jgi:hypothetical protein
MGFEALIQHLRLNGRFDNLPVRAGPALLQLLEVFRGRGTADDAVSPVAEGRLVDDRVINIPGQLLSFAPDLREDVMDVDGLIEEDRVVVVLPTGECQKFCV